MKAMFDFLCPECGVFERYTDVDNRMVRCDCGMISIRQVCAPSSFKIDGFPSGIDGDAWAKTRIDNARKLNDRNYHG